MDEQGNQTLTVEKGSGAATGAGVDAGVDRRDTNRQPADSNESNNADDSITTKNTISSSDLKGETNAVIAERTDTTTIGDIAGGTTSGGFKDGGTGTGTSGEGQIENSTTPE